MIKSITVTNYIGESIILELTRPEKSGFIIKSVDGLGPAKANVNMTTLAATDGNKYNSAFLDQRDLVFNLEFYQTATETIEDIRHKSYRYFPIKKKAHFVIETDNRVVETDGYVEANEPNIFSNTEGCTITVICPDPWLYSRVTTETVFSGINPIFEFPFENDSLTEPLLELSTIETKTEQTVYYAGDAEVGISIRMYAIGDVSNITIYNVTTREHLYINTDKLTEITGAGLGKGDTINIETRKGNKSITLLRDGKKINILNCLNKGNDWFTLTKGDNIFAYVAESGSTNLQFCISHKVIYEGV